MLLVTDLMDVKWCKNPCSGESSFDVNRVNSNIGEKMGYAVGEVIKCNMLRRFSHLVMKLPEDSSVCLRGMHGTGVGRQSLVWLNRA